LAKKLHSLEVQKLSNSTNAELSATIRSLRHAPGDAPTTEPASPFHQQALDIVAKLANDLSPEQRDRVLKEIAKINPPVDEIEIKLAGRIPVKDRIPPSEEDLVKVDEYGEEITPSRKLKKGERVYRLLRPALNAYRQLRAAAQQAGFSKETFALTSDFRPQKKQDKLKAQSLTRYGDASESRKWTASLSEHITGMAFDLQVHPGIKNDSALIDVLKATPEYKWLHENAPRFGLNEFLPVGNVPGEPWHFSYNVEVIRIRPQFWIRMQK